MLTDTWLPFGAFFFFYPQTFVLLFMNSVQTRLNYNYATRTTPSSKITVNVLNLSNVFLYLNVFLSFFFLPFCSKLLYWICHCMLWRCERVSIDIWGEINTIVGFELRQKNSIPQGIEYGYLSKFIFNIFFKQNKKRQFIKDIGKWYWEHILPHSYSNIISLLYGNI